MERYTINDIRSELERKRGEPLTDDGFGVLIAGFKGFAARRGWYTRQATEKALKQGWMTEQMAHFFKAYALE